MKPIRTHTGDDLVLGILAKRDGDQRLLGREIVCEADLLPARDDAFLRGVRAGLLGTDLAKVSMNIIPGETVTPDRVVGYTIELRDEGKSYRQRFGLTSLAPVARRAVARLVEQEALKDGDDYSFFLTTVRPDGDAEPVEGKSSANGHNGMKATRRQESLVLEPARLQDYVRNSELLTGCTEPTEAEVEPPMPIFVADDVWKEGHDLARRGGELESAAVWTGRLMRDTESPEVFMLLEACLEAEHAQEEKLAVTFSGETWARIRELLDMRRRRLNRPHERILGSVHGHPFLPEADEKGNRKCSLCATAKVCSRTTAIASLADIQWHLSVFCGQPWATLTVWGFTAREEEDWRVYGLSEATLQPRTIRRLK
jgi:hypothetical protein